MSSRAIALEPKVQVEPAPMPSGFPHEADMHTGISRANSGVFN